MAAASYAWGRPVKPQNRPSPFSFSTCWSVSKDSWKPAYQLLYPPVSPLGKVPADFSPGLLPCLPTPQLVPPVQLLHPVKTQAKPISGLN